MGRILIRPPQFHLLCTLFNEATTFGISEAGSSTSVFEITEVVKPFFGGKAPGMDGTCPKFLNFGLPDALVRTVQALYNLCQILVHIAGRKSDLFSVMG